MVETSDRREVAEMIDHENATRWVVYARRWERERQIAAREFVARMLATR